MTKIRRQLLESYIKEAITEYSSRGGSYVEPSGVWSTVVDKLSGFFGLRPDKKRSSPRGSYVDDEDDYDSSYVSDEEDYEDDKRIRVFIFALQSWFGKLERAYGRRLPEGKKLEIASGAVRMYQRFLGRRQSPRDAASMTLGYLSSKYGLTKKDY